MRTLSTSIYLAADVGVPTEVEPAGTSLEKSVCLRQRRA